MADSLQEEVKECINDFIDANIKCWIVTGDKDSTAKQIGYQCGILDETRKMVNLSEKSLNCDIDSLKQRVLNLDSN